MKPFEYWHNKAINQLLSSESAVLAYEELLLHAYDLAIINMKKEVDSFYSKYGTNGKIPYADTKKRLTESERKVLNELLRKWYQDALTKDMPSDYKTYLVELGKKKYITRLEYLQACVRYEAEDAKDKQIDEFIPLVEQGFIYSYYNTYYYTAIGMEVSIPYESVVRGSIERITKLRWNGQNYSDRIWKDKARLIDAMNKIIPRSIAQGLNPRDVGDLLAKELNVSKNAGRTLARTEMNRICNQAALNAYKAIGIKKYKFVATLDMRTSEICRGMDGFIGLVSQAVEDINYPPMHPNCRSTTVPYFEDLEFADDSDRIARDEEGKNIKVSRRTTQEEWIKQYVPDDQQGEFLKFKEKYGHYSEKVE